MLLPELLFGTCREVAPRARRFVRSLSSGGSKDQIPCIDTRAVTGLIVVDSYAENEKAARNFQLFTPMNVAATTHLPPDVEALGRLFDTLLEFEWGPLALLDQSVGHHVSVDEGRRAAFLRAFLRHWKEYSAEGTRYGPGRDNTLWGAAMFLKYNLLVRGVPQTEVLAPLPNDDLRNLMTRHSDKFGDVLTKLPQ